MFRKEIHFRINELHQTHQNDTVVLFYPEIKIITRFSKGRWQLLDTSKKNLIYNNVFWNISKYYKYDSIWLHNNFPKYQMDLDNLIKLNVKLYGEFTYTNAMKIIDTYIECKLKNPDVFILTTLHRVFEYDKISKSYVEKDNKNNEDK